MRVVMWLALACGCGRIGFGASATDAAADGAAACGATAPCTVGLCASDNLCHPIVFEDHFDGATIDPTWQLMRFEFALQNGQLHTTPTVRPGFNYGQGGNGRSAVAALHIGDASWTDLRVEWTQQSEASLLIVDSTLPPCQHTPGAFFRIESYEESWNAPENTMYEWSIDQGCQGPIGPTGSWGLGATWQVWIPGTGWSTNQMGQGFSLANGLDASIADAPVRFVLEARGAQLQVWADGVLVLDHVDAFAYTGGASAPAFGGVAFTSAWEQMFWIDDVVVADLTR